MNTTDTDWAAEGVQAAVYRTTDYGRGAHISRVVTVERVTATQILAGDKKWRRSDGTLIGEKRGEWNANGQTRLLPLDDRRVSEVRAAEARREAASALGTHLDKATGVVDRWGRGESDNATMLAALDELAAQIAAARAAIEGE